MPMTKLVGLVEDRKPREPAPLHCEGACDRVTMHTFARGRDIRPNRSVKLEYHDCYTCDVCSHERVWG